MSVKTFGTTRSRAVFAAILGAALLVAALTIGSANNASADSAVRAKKTKVLGAIEYGRLPTSEYRLSYRPGIMMCAVDVPDAISQIPFSRRCSGMPSDAPVAPGTAIVTSWAPM